MDSSGASFEDIFLEGPYENLSGLSDGKLLTEDGSTFEVHRVILAKENQYFKALFCGIGKDRREFSIPGIRGRILDHILLYIYTGTIHLTKANICEILVASDYLMADNLVLQIQKFTESNTGLDNCLLLYRTALKINHEDILRGIYRFIQTHFEAVVDVCAEVFGDISLESLKRFLTDRNLCIRGEHILWSAIEKWVQEDNIRRLRHAPDLLKCLNVADMDESLATEIINSDVVSENPLCTEMNDIIHRSKLSSSLDVLLECFSENISAPSSDFYYHRGPERMHLIARYHNLNLTDGIQIQNLTDGIQIYITYDENVDLWRKLGEEDFCPTYMISIGNAVYMFDYYHNRNISFNLFDRKWNEMRSCRIPRVSYRLVNLQNTINILGGEFIQTGEKLLDVEFYKPDVDLWFDAASMLPVTSFASVAYLDNIFVVGKIPVNTGVGMVAQVYDTESNMWSLFDPPKLYREDFAFTVYHKKLYIIGGTNGSELLHEVEVFDVARRAWEKAEDLPHSYYLPKAIVLNDRLIVFDGLLEDSNYFQKNPPVSWNKVDERWEPLDKFLPLMDLALYLFCVLDDKERVNALLREQRSENAI